MSFIQVNRLLLSNFEYNFSQPVPALIHRPVRLGFFPALLLQPFKRNTINFNSEGTATFQGRIQVVTLGHRSLSPHLMKRRLKPF
jgi:hypothetical protein